MKKLIHNGVLITRYEWKRFHIFLKGVKVELAPKQEEMAVAWVRKLGTDYVNDKVFVRNFFREFCEALNVNEKLSPMDFDFSAIEDYLEREKALKLSLSNEEKRRLREQRRVMREASKETYGYALVDGIKMEISNYAAEPSCIFMGRGRHPLRGRWKEGPDEEDVELNLSPNAPRPPGNWKAVVWYPDVMWTARWRDKLTGRMRYVWLSENSAVKQRKDIEKFDMAKELRRNLPRIKAHILSNLDADDAKRRKTATVCYLIDELKIRVGDEKDPDEADTVGASTLRPEHIHFREDGKVIFNFLGKDSVPNVFEVELPDRLVRNLKEFSADAGSILFTGVDSERVSEFLDEVMVGLSAKVFRTCYASEVVEDELGNTPVKISAPDHTKKYVATMANLEAAKICNHRRTIPKTWGSSLQKKESRLKERVKGARQAEEKIERKAREEQERYEARLVRQEEKLDAVRERLQTYQKQMVDRERQGKAVGALKRRVSSARKAIGRQRERLRSLKRKYNEQRRKLKERLDRQRERDRIMIEKMRLQIETQKETRDYNLGTSLKSYIDPRIYYSWGKQVEYDWKLYYPKALQRKFSWVEIGTDESASKQING